MSSYDIAICYFGLPRSVKYVYESHQKYIYDVLNDKGITYKKFMHTWKTGDGSQRVWRFKTREKIDYEEYKLLNPDVSLAVEIVPSKVKPANPVKSIMGLNP